MKKSCDSISVVIPFYKGTQYMDEILSNLDRVAATVLASDNVQMDVIIVNDSPEVAVSYSQDVNIPVTIINNPENRGIHFSRINGIRHAKGEWIQMLDQDDLLIPENYPAHVHAAVDCDVVVSNCLYYFSQTSQKLYPNRAVMEYCIQEKRFLNIRNFIASPGHCLVRKASIPTFWLENPMTANGSDDYLLWLLMFDQGARFNLNDTPVYIHRNSEEGNLSFDLDKMHRSNEQICTLLSKADYPSAKQKTLCKSIVFKYLYDTHKLTASDWLRYTDKYFDNACYKAKTLLLRCFN